MINLNRILRNLKGEEIKMSFPPSEDAVVQPETVRNVLINSLSGYPVKDRKEIFFVTTIAGKILEAGETIELNPIMNKFLVDVVYEATYRIEGGKRIGVYLPMIASQVLDELGIKNNVTE